MFTAVQPLEEAAPTDPAVVAERRARAAALRSLSWRLRRLAAPICVITLVGAAGAIAQTAPTAALVAAGAYATVAAVVWFTVEQRGRRRRGRNRHRRYRSTVTIAGLAWIGWTAAAGAGSWRAVTLVFAGAVLSIGSWMRNGIPIPPLPGALPAVPEVEHDDATQLVEAWNASLACPTGCVPGMPITATTIPNGVRAVVRVVKGRQSVRTIESNLETIRAACGWPQVTVEPSNEFPDLVVLTFSRPEKSVTVNPILWQGPLVDELGRIDLGPYTDGQGVHHFQLFGPDGVLSGFFGGDPRQGKTQMAANVLLSSAAAGLLVPFLIAPTPAAAPPALADWVRDRAMSLPDSLALLEGLVAVLDYRLAQNHVMGWVGYDTTQGRPIIGTFFPECHETFANKAARILAERITREGPKVGMMGLADSQDTTLAAFGSSAPLRAALCPNVACVYTSNRDAQSVLTGLLGNPTTLPQGRPGVAFGGPQGRPTPFRGRIVDATWYERIEVPELDPGSANILEGALSGWRARAAARDAWRADWVRAMEDGVPPPPLPPDEPEPDQEGDAAHPARGAAPQGLLGFEAPRLVGTGPRVTARDRVLKALNGGPLPSGALQSTTGLSDKGVRDAMKELVEAGLAEPKAYKGDPWRLTLAGVAAASALRAAS